MKIGFMGLGKLGLPVALAIQEKGHDISGYDVAPQGVMRAMSAGLWVAENLEDLVRDAEIVFVAIQTPHGPEFEGVTRLPFERQDFDYSYLMAGLHDLANAIRYTHRETGTWPVVAIISTVLPGTTDTLLKPILQGIPIVYNPSFITMGHVREDFLAPEFVLIGVDDPDAADLLEQFYATITNAPRRRMRVKDAELAKVAYNVALTSKIVFANTLLEICHKTGCDVDAVTDALRFSTKRIASGAYYTAGMGEGGPCRPRDTIAMSWLARKLGLGFDLFEAFMLQREKQAEWLADLMCEYDGPRVILGRSYKPDTDIETGSHSRLVADILRERGEQFVMFDPRIDGYGDEVLPRNAVILVGTKHPQFASYRFPHGSTVIDPWRYIPDREGVTVIGLGRPRRQDLSLVR